MNETLGSMIEIPRSQYPESSEAAIRPSADATQASQDLLRKGDLYRYSKKPHEHLAIPD